MVALVNKMKRRYRRIYFVFDKHPALLFAISIILTYFVYWRPLFGSGERPFEAIDALTFTIIVFVISLAIAIAMIEIAIRCDYFKVLKRYNSVKYSRELADYVTRPFTTD